MPGVSLYLGRDYAWGGGAGRPFVTRLVVWSPLFVRMAKCPWVEHWPPKSFRWTCSFTFMGMWLCDCVDEWVVNFKVLCLLGTKVQTEIRLRTIKWTCQNWPICVNEWTEESHSLRQEAAPQSGGTAQKKKVYFVSPMSYYRYYSYIALNGYTFSKLCIHQSKSNKQIHIFLLKQIHKRWWWLCLFCLEGAPESTWTMSLVAALDVMLLQTVTILSSSFMSPSFDSVCSVHPL